jgi:hypothetical protein
MPEIGQTLREARMRRRIDMTEVESATKIRAKYLRALENEEWDLLPGPTFVRTFLRTYAEYLGLDPRVLVEEYRQRFDQPSTQDLTPFGAARRGAQARRKRTRLSALGPILVVGLGAVMLLGALYVLGSLGDDPETPATPNAVRESEPTPGSNGNGNGGGQGGGGNGSGKDKQQDGKQQRPKRVEVQLVATGPVYVCLVDAGGRQVIDEETLEPGTRTQTYRSKSFRTNFGNSNLRMRVDGRSYPVAESADPVGYLLRPGRKPQRLDDAQRPDCSS